MSAKKRILMVDDDKDYLDLTLNILEHEGYEVLTALDGASGLAMAKTATSVSEALTKYQATDPDLVLVDLMMEEADSGFAFVRAIRGLGPAPPLYLLSGVGADLATLTEFTEIGLTDVLQKPVDPTTLIRLVRSKLRNRKQAGEQ